MVNFTRRQLASYAAKALIAKNSQIIPQLAAYLYESGRAKEVDLLIRDIDSALNSNGYISAEISSHYKLDDNLRTELKTLLSKRYNSENINISESIDSGLLGGIKIKTADEEFDGSLRRKINSLKMTKA